MEIKYYGANCLRISDKNISIVIDDNLNKYGLKNVTKAEDVCIFTDPTVKDCKGRFLINGPGEYEISEVSILGIPASSQIENKEGGSTVFSLAKNNLKIGIIGHINADLNEDQLEKIGIVDLLIIPVGGNGFTVDAHGAVQLIKQMEPKTVIPTHFSDSAIPYEVPQASLDIFLKELGNITPDYMSSFKLKENVFSDSTKLVILERQN